MLQKIPEYFQRFSLARGFSTRHKCDMAREKSDFVLGSVELERLGVFDRAGIDHQQFAATEREAQVEILGLGDLRDRRGKNPRHRPPGIDSPLLRDKIVQAVLFERAANPKKQMKKIVGEIGSYYEVDRSYVFRCLKEVAPERRKQIVESIIVSCFWPEGLAYLYGLVAAATFHRNRLL